MCTETTELSWRKENYDREKAAFVRVRRSKQDVHVQQYYKHTVRAGSAKKRKRLLKVESREPPQIRS